ncbi:MAG: hypothetical protein AAGA58_00520 [Verrucomicrobiota bacterium]
MKAFQLSLLCIFTAVSVLAQEPAITPSDSGASITLEDKSAKEEDMAKVSLDDGALQPEAPTEQGSEMLDPSKRAEVVQKAQEETGDVEKLRALSVEDRRKVTEMLQEASEFVMGIRVQEAFERLVKVEAIAPDLFALHNLKGAAYTKIRDFEKARESFEKAVSMAPRSFMAKFNLNELDFVSGANKERSKKGAGLPDLQKAAEGFEALGKQLRADVLDLEQAQINANAANDLQKANLYELRIAATSDTIRLMDYKVLICHLLLGNEGDVQRILDTFHFMDDVPAFYYSNASIAFHADDEEQAQDWIRQAKSIYDKSQNDIYIDSLVEIGWIDSFQ